MAIVCAYVPGASRLSFCISGRLRSDHSSSLRYVSMRVNSSAGGRSIIASDTDTAALSAPQSALRPISGSVQSSVSPIASAPSR